MWIQGLLNGDNADNNDDTDSSSDASAGEVKAEREDTPTGFAAPTIASNPTAKESTLIVASSSKTNESTPSEIMLLSYECV